MAQVDFWIGNVQTEARCVGDQIVGTGGARFRHEEVKIAVREHITRRVGVHVRWILGASGACPCGRGEIGEGKPGALWAVALGRCVVVDAAILIVGRRRGSGGSGRSWWR